MSLPHGTGNHKNSCFCFTENEKAAKEAGADIVGGEDLIEDYKNRKTDFEIAVADMDMMKNLAKIAKILGTRGLMPSKNDTVTNNPAKAIEELKRKN